jgi:hypothetical protein
MGPNGNGNGMGGRGNVAAFPAHLYARGPRDFFMIDTDPRSSPYTYGLTSYTTNGYRGGVSAFEP